MTKERELLRRAQEFLKSSHVGHDLIWPRADLYQEIETFLSNPSDDAEEPEAKPVLYIKEQELLYIQVLKQEGLAQEWKSNLGFVKEDGDVGLYLHPPRPAESEAEYDFYGVIPLTHRKAKGIIKDKGYHVTGFVLSRPDGDKCIIDMSAVRWLTGKEFFEMLHPPVFSPTAEPEAETIETLKAENFALASGQCTEGGPWGDQGGTPYCKYAEPAARKPMTREEIIQGVTVDTSDDFHAGFWAGIRYAEKHHGITDADV